MYRNQCAIFLFFVLLCMDNEPASGKRAPASHMVQFILSNGVVKNIDHDSNNSIWYESFQKQCETVFIIHGWHSTAMDPSYIDIMKAYQEIPDACINTIAVNWSDALHTKYSASAGAVHRVAEEVAMFIRKLKKLDVLDQVEIVGFSLGAHVAGIANRHLSQILGHADVVKAIFGLDPAGAGFTDYFMPFWADRLQATDAPIVVTLMTNAGCLGTTQHLGTVNFIANNGRSQVGCAMSDCICSHHRALEYFVESLNSEDEFVATNRETGEQEIFVGYGLNITERGDYYFNTSSLPPYAKISVFR